MKNKKNWIAIILMLIAGATALYWLRRGNNKTHLRSMQIYRGDLTVHVLATGTVLPQNRVEIKAPVPGRMERVLVEEGQKLNKGHIIAWMSSLERAAMLDAARAKGEDEYAKWSELYLPIPIVAPISGSLILRSVEPGQTFTSAESIFTMSDRLTVKAQVDETDISKIKLNTLAQIILDAYPSDIIDARVDQIAFDAKIINNVTTYIVDVIPKVTPPHMRSGMTANVTFLLESKKNILLVPSEALRVESGRTIVNVPDNNGNPEAKEIQVGMSDGKNTELLQGLEEGSTVLVPELKLELGSQKSSNPFSPFGGSRGMRR